MQTLNWDVVTPSVKGAVLLARDRIGLGKLCASKIIPLLFTGYFAGRSLHSSGPLEGFRNICPGTQAAEEVEETGLLFPTHAASLTYLDYSPKKNPNCILGTNENSGLGFCTSPFLPCLAPSFAKRWPVPLKWMHRFPCSAELREHQGTPALTGSETFFVQVSWAAGKPHRATKQLSSHMQWGGRGEEGERMKWGWASSTLDSLPA